ncbi:CvpA family protein [Candidatus Microgenomates bacterium]|nr:CvpA family protein [Candidatus Microgenomates bacterium]
MFNVNWVDIGFAAILIYFILSSHGFIQVVIEFLTLFVSMTAAFTFYSEAGKLVESLTRLPAGISQAAGFFLVWFIFETVLSLILRFTLFPLLRPFLVNKVNKWLGYAAGAFQGMLFFLFIVSLVFALPVRGNVKQAVLDSKTGPFFVSSAQQFQGAIKGVLGNALMDSLNFMTVKPESGAQVDLKFKADGKNLTVDSQSETVMLNLVNKERTSRGLNPLLFDGQMQKVARAYAQEMLIHGFFSHTSAVDGTTPADRVTRAGIDYMVVGENLAYAPDVYIAHTGLMNSPGHKANILSSDYGRVGIGIIDAGIYGRMFVQEFKD